MMDKYINVHLKISLFGKKTHAQSVIDDKKIK